MVVIDLSAKVLLALGLEAAVEAVAAGASVASPVGRLRSLAGGRWAAPTASASSAIARAGKTLGVPVTEIMNQSLAELILTRMVGTHLEYWQVEPEAHVVGPL